MSFLFHNPKRMHNFFYYFCKRLDVLRITHDAMNSSYIEPDFITHFYENIVSYVFKSFLNQYT